MSAAVEHYESFRFEQTKVRVFTIDGRKLAVGADVCAALDIKNSRDALSRLDSEDRLTISRSDTVGCSDGIWNGFAPQVQSVTLISENGATDLILESRKPEARRFRHWLTHTVWPSIRDTGSYSAAPELTEDQIVHRALHILDNKVKVLTSQVAELTAPARSWQLLADARGDFSVAEAAKILSRDPAITTGRDRLFDYMADQKWIFRSRNPRGGWEAYQTAVDTGRLVEKPAKPFLNSKTGAYELPAPTIRVTAKGIGKLHELMGGSEPIRFVVGEAS